MQPLQSARSFRTFLHDSQSLNNRRSRLGLFTLEDRQAAGSLMDMLLAGAMASDRAQPIPAPADDPRFGVVTATTALPEADTVALLGQAQDEATNVPAGDFVSNPAGQFTGFDDFEAVPNTTATGAFDWRVAPFITLGINGGFVDEAVPQPFSRATPHGDTVPVPTSMKSNEIPSFFRSGVGTDSTSPKGVGYFPQSDGGDGDGGGDGGVVAISKAVVTHVEYLGPVIRIAADPGTPAYPMSGPQYVDNNADGVIDPAASDLSLPIAYPRNSTVTVNATFKVETEFYPGPAVDGNVWIEAYGLSGMFFPKPATWTGNTVTVTGLSSNQPLENYVQYGEASELHFVLRRSVPDGFRPIYAGKSVNEIYVTLAAPNISPLYHTYLHISIPNAAAVQAVAEAVVIDQTWKSFETRTIQNKHINPAFSGKPLTYYKEWDTNAGTSDALLATLDGRCGGFAQLFMRSIRAAGATTTPIMPTQVYSAVDGMLIKNWNFIGPGTAGNNKAPYLWQNTLADPTQNPNNFPGGFGCYVKKYPDGSWGYYWGATVEVSDTIGAFGQNTWNPKSHFSDHMLIKISGVYYDPSYGNKFNSKLECEDASVAGFYTVEAFPNNTYRLIIRQNLAAPDISETELPNQAE